MSIASSATDDVNRRVTRGEPPRPRHTSLGRATRYYQYGRCVTSHGSLGIFTRKLGADMCEESASWLRRSPKVPKPAASRLQTPTHGIALLDLDRFFNIKLSDFPQELL